MHGPELRSYAPEWPLEVGTRSRRKTEFTQSYQSLTAAFVDIIFYSLRTSQDLSLVTEKLEK